jgi:eukaryotic-like serine/threonine-protein kinase
MSANQLPTRRRSGAPGIQSAADRGGLDRAAGEAPLVLSRYRLQRRLGAGGFGTVWLARDERLDREVAVKIVPAGRIVGGRFQREARAAARLAHPGIVTLYEAAVDDQGAYLVSELVRGATLHEALHAGRLSDQDIVSIGIALCDALAHAHSQGVVHRDVKPSNVLIPDRQATPAQVAKLTDFGVARVVGGDSLTGTGDVVGTAAYMAPEQAEGLQAGESADLYSLALVLSEALTGVNPVRTGTAAQRARRLGAHLPPLRRQRRDLPREMGQGIDLALRPRPRERGSLVELRRALAAAQGQVRDRPGVVATPWPGRARHEESGIDGRGEDPLAAEHDAVREPEATDAARDVWPSRALAAGATAGLAAWMSSRLLSSQPLTPAVVAMLAGGLTLALPRIGWVAMTVSFCLTAALEHHAGAALVVFLGALLPMILLPRRGTAWPLAAGAPALGLIGLAGAWPALAARARTSWRRAVLGLTGWVWLLIAGPVADRVLYLPHRPGTPPARMWIGSPDQAVHHVLAPLASGAVLAPALVWAMAAVVLPWLISGYSLAGDAVRVTIWAVLLVLATTVISGLLHGPQGTGAPPSAVLGAVGGAAVAIAPTAINAWHAARHPPGPSTGFA